MPVYRFQCECGVNFSARVANAVSEAKCPDCGEGAVRDLPRTVGVTTSVVADGLKAPMTGLSAHDYEFDRVVGADAKAKWERISDRQKDKIRVIQREGVTGFDLSKRPNGEYGVMRPEERAASERTRAFHAKMDSHLRKKHPEVQERLRQDFMRGRPSR